MLGRRDLYAAPDDTIETWCLLVVEYSDSGDCVGWHVGFGNVKQIVRRESMSTIDASDEVELLNELMEQQIQPVRSDDRQTTVITPLESTLPKLRTRLYDQNIESTFRGLAHFSLEELIEQYFHSQDSTKDSCRDTEPENIIELEFEEYEHPVKELWRQVKQVGPLVPRRAISGHQL